MLIYTTTDTNYRVNRDSKVVTTESGEEQSDFVIMLYENDTCYVAIDYVVRFTDMTYEVFTEPTLKDAVKRVSSDHGLSKNELYDMAIKG